MVMEQSTFRESLDFFYKVGIYDVVLPFLLVYTIVFAIFEKTKVLGTDEIEGKTYTKKNINAMVAFVIAFLVIASAKMVEIITTVSSQMVILLMLSVFFLLLIGSFWQEGKGGVFLDPKTIWYKIFMIIMFVGIVLIFLNALGWLQLIIGFIGQFWTSAAVSSIILIVIIIFFMWLITVDSSGKAKSESKE